MNRLSINFGLALFAATAVGCFQESSTLGLPCTQNDQCGVGQECGNGECYDPADTGPPATNTSDDETSTTSSEGEPCAVSNEIRCDPVGVDAQVCTNGFWQNVSCDQQCMNNNAPPGKQAGACVDEGGDPVCLCADSIGGECEGSEPTSCTESGLLEFCTQGRFFRLMCSTSCADDGYPVGGPCIPEGQGQGSASCQCADGEGGTCTIAEQFEEGCESNTIHRKCVDGTQWLTDCEAECQRLGQMGGTCQDTGDGNFSCVCG